MEEHKFEEKGELIGKYEKNETQLFLEKVFSKEYYFEGYRLKFGKDERLDWDEYLYEWFEIYKKKGKKRLCFGFWDEKDAGIRWFIDKEEVDLIKSKCKPKN